MNLYEKISAIMGEVKSLKKDGNVNFKSTNYNFLSEAKTTDTFHELFVKHKIVLLPVGAVETQVGQITHGHYKYKLINAETPEENIILETTGQGQDSMDKGSGKSSSYAYKYLLWRTFMVPSNDDPDNVSSEELREKEAALNKKINKKDQDQLIDLALETDSDVNTMLNYYKVTDVDQMNKQHFNEAVAGYKKKLSKQKKEA